jgi:hypothetical protein
MRYLLFVFYLAAFVGAGCMDDTSGVGEIVMKPEPTSGPDTLLIGQPGEFSSGRSFSSRGHTIEYRFDFDAAANHDCSDWRREPKLEKSWPDSGHFQVKAQARCVKHPGNTSPWSAPKHVAVILGGVLAPDTVTGLAIVWTDSMETYCTARVPGSDLYPAEYRFDFDAAGAHHYSAWMDTICREMSWADPGDYVVKAQGRRVNDTDLVSPWSPGLTVTVNQYTLPEIHFATTITWIDQHTSRTITKPYIPGVLDTVGVCRPLKISYHGASPWVPILKYQFFPLSQGIYIDDQSEWTTDLSDTIRSIDLCGNDYYNGIFRLAAQCEDAREGRSIIDAGQFEQGVCQVVVNFDPDTKITQLLNTYYINQTPVQRWIDFKDAVPDTIPYNSWVKLFYRGWDSPYDSVFCQDVTNRCIKYQRSYHWYSGRVPHAEERSAHLPPGGDDNDPFNVADTSSMNFGSVEYEIFVRSLDEHGRPDGTPDMVELVGNFDPILDECYLEDHLGNQVENGDTLTWNWWRPANTDTFNQNTFEFEKKFRFIINASGHDHPMEPTSGVKNWTYNFYDLQSVNVRFARSGPWVAGNALNALSDTFKVTFSYPLTDPTGDQVFSNLPDWINTTYDLVLMGRDTGMGEEFSQYMFIDEDKELLNVYPVTPFGRWTEEKTVRFHLRLVR